MAKISGVGLGEIKKMSGLGVGAIKKVSGLGSGLIWQDIVIQTIVKNGSFAVSVSDTTVTGWLPGTDSTVLNEGIRVPESKLYMVEVVGTVTNANTISSRWLQMSFYRNATEFYDGPQINIPANASNLPFSMADPTPRSFTAGDYINLRADAQAVNLTILNGTILRITSVS